MNINNEYISSNNILIPVDTSRITAAVGDNFTHNSKIIPNYGLCWTNDSDAEAIGHVGNMSGFGGLRFFTEMISRLSITGDGFVGIGTDLPLTKLDVSGNLNVTGTSYGAYADCVSNRITTLENIIPSGTLKFTQVINTIGPLTTASGGISVNGYGKFSGNVTIGSWPYIRGRPSSF